MQKVLGCLELFPAGLNPAAELRMELSGKMMVLDSLLAVVKASGSGDKARTAVHQWTDEEV